MDSSHQFRPQPIVDTILLINLGLVKYDAPVETQNGKDTLIKEYYTVGRNYGLYRYVQDLSPSQEETLLLVIQEAGFDSDMLQQAIDLRNRVKEEGHTEDTRAFIKAFDKKSA